MKNRKASVPTLPTRIRQARIRRGLSKTELARRVGVSLSAVLQWEYSRGTAPKARHLASIAEATGVAFEWLATGRGSARVSNGDGPPAIEPSSIAITLFEERLLQIARRVPNHRQEPLLEFLTAWTEKGK